MLWTTELVSTREHPKYIRVRAPQQIPNFKPVDYFAERTGCVANGHRERARRAKVSLPDDRWPSAKRFRKGVRSVYGPRSRVDQRLKPSESSDQHCFFS